MHFPYMLARDNETVCVDVEAHIDPPDTDVGIMGSCVIDVTVRDAKGMIVQVTDAEYEAIMKDAQDRVNEGCDFPELDDIL